MRNSGLPLHANPTKRIVYSSYWGTYSRVLQYPIWNHFDQKHFLMIEVNITPVNGLHATQSEWDRCRDINIRRHGTQIDGKDRFTDVIPLDWFNLLGERWGEARRDFILYGNILELIDWVKYNKHNNGGCPLEKCLLDDKTIGA